MKVAVIGDVHSNVYALESVLLDIKRRDIDCILGTGDLVGYLPYPNEVVELFRKHNILSVQGNHDALIGNDYAITNSMLNGLEEKELQANASRHYTNKTITDENRKYLKYMTKSIRMDISGKSIAIVHGSPSSQKEYLYNEEEALLKWSERINEDILICGHTHIPYVNYIGEKVFINAGSVGKPKHGNGNATYVVLDVKDKVHCEIIEVPYEKDKLFACIKNEPMISDTLIDMLENGY